MKKFIFLIAFFIFISLVSANAETIVTGKIYDSAMLIDENSVSTAFVVVKCYHNNSICTKETTSLNDGTYGVGFNDSDCGIGDSVNVTASTDNLKGSNIGIIYEKVGMNISLVNVVIKVKEEKKIKRERKFCGDGECDDFRDECSTCPVDCSLTKTNVCRNDGFCTFELGEDCSTSPEDCACSAGYYCSGGVCIKQDEGNGNWNTGGGGGGGGGGGAGIGYTPISSSNTQQEKTVNEKKSDLGILEVEDKEKSFISKITGAVIGGGAAGILLPVMFILLVILAAIVIYMKRMKR